MCPCDPTTGHVCLSHRTKYAADEQVPAAAQRIRDSEGGPWRRSTGDLFAPESAGGNMPLAEIIDLFGPVTVLDTAEENPT